MSYKKTIIEIAGVKAGVYGQIPDDIYGDFTGDGKEDFSLFLDYSRSGVFSKEAFYDEDDVMDFAISERDGIVHVCSAASAEAEIGNIDLAGSTARLNVYSEELLPVLFAPFLRLCFQLFLARVGGIIVHACGVAANGKGYLFPGPSGSGKSTIASMMPSEAELISDEFMAIKKTDGRFLMCATPWRTSNNISVEVVRVFFPGRAAETEIRTLGASEAFSRFMPNVLCSAVSEKMILNVMDMLKDLLDKVVVRELLFSLDSPVWNCVKAEGVHVS